MKSKAYFNNQLLAGTHLGPPSTKIIKTTLITTTILSSLATPANADIYRSNNGGTMVTEIGQTATNVRRPLLNLMPVADWEATDSLYWDGKTQDLIIGANGNAGDAATLDLDGSTNRTITVAESSAIGSIIGTGGGSATLIINDGRTATFSDVSGQNANQGAQAGGVYNVLNAITLGNANGSAASLTINVGTTISAPIDSASTSTNAGNININSATTFSSTIGATYSVGTIDVANTANFNAAVTAESLSVNGGTADLNAAFTGDIASTANGGTLSATTIDGNLDFTNGGTVTSAESVTGNATLASDASITTIGNITGNATLSGTSTATSTSTVGGNLNVSGSARFIGSTDDTDVTGTVTVDSDAAATTIHDATGAVTLTSGALTMHDAASTVDVTTGTLNMNNATGAVTIAAGDITINDVAAGATINGGTVAIHDATGVAATVTVNGGALTINDITNDLAITSGTVTSANSVGGDVAASGGTITSVGNIGGNATLSNTSTASIAGTIGGDLTLNDTASADIAGDITGTTTADANTTLNFTGAGTTTGAVTADSGFSASANRTFSHATLSTPSIALSGSGTSLELTSADLGAIDVTTSAGDSSNDITVNVEQTITGDIGAVGNQLGSLVLNVDVAANINTATFYADVITAADGDGTVNFGSAATHSRDFGDDTNALKAINFNADVTTSGSLYAGTITVANGRTATLNGAAFADLSIDGGTADLNAAFTGDIASTANGGTLSATTIDGNLDFTNGGTVSSATSITGNATLASDASITTIGNIGGNATLSGTSTATSTGTVGGNLNVSGSARFIGSTDDTDVTGTVTVDSDAAATTIHDATGAVTLTSGALTMNDTASTVDVTTGTLNMNNATGAVTIAAGSATINDVAAGATINGGTVSIHDATGANSTVTVNGGALTINDITHDLAITAGTVTSANSVGGDVTASGGTITSVGGIAGNATLSGSASVTSISAITGNLDVSGSARFIGHTTNTDVSGVVNINSSNVNTSRLHDALNDVTLAAGMLTMNNATGVASAVTVNGGDLTINDVTGANSSVTVAAGTLTMNDAANDVSVNGGIVSIHDATSALATVTVNGGSFSANTITNDLAITGGTVTSIASVGGDVAASGGIISNIDSVTGALTLTNNANVSISGDIDGIITTGANSSLTFTDTGTIAKDITALGAVTVQADRTFAKNINIATLAIQGADTNITLKTTDLGATNVTSNKIDASHKITVFVDQNINGNIGSDTNPLGSLILNKDVLININTSNFHSNINTKIDNKGRIVFNNDNTMAINLGNADRKLKSVTFKGNALVSKSVYASSISITNTKAATFGLSVNSDEVKLLGASAKAILADGSTLNAPITGTSGGLVEFAGSSTINFDLGDNTNALTSVTFADDATKTAALSADIFAADIVLNKGALQLAKAAAITGDVATSDSILDFTDKALTANGNITLNGDNVVRFTITDSGENTELTGGTITINGNLDFAGGATLSIEPTDLRVFKSTENPRSFSLFDVTGAITGADNNSNITSNDSWSVNITDNIISITETIVEEAPAPAGPPSETTPPKTAKEKRIARKNIIDNLKRLMPKQAASMRMDRLLKTESGGKVLDLVSNFTATPNKIEETMRRLTKNNNTSRSVISTMSNVTNSIDARVVNITAPATTINTSTTIIQTANSNYISGVAAGDEKARYGAWFSPFYSNLSQKEKNIASGYVNESYGASIGFDIRSTNDTIIGLALTAANSKITHKDLKLGDQTKVESLLFSIYASQNITDNWFALSTGTIAINEVENRSKRVSSATDYEIATSNYISTSLSIKEVFGYNYNISNSTITPMLGLKFSRVNATKYQETGTNFQNLNISIKASNTFEAIAGLRLQSSHAFNSMSIIPEIHGFVNYELFNKTQRPTATLENDELDTSNTKDARANYNLGAGITFTNYENEVSLNYDLQLADKRIGHQGSIKLRVSF